MTTTRWTLYCLTCECRVDQRAMARECRRLDLPGDLCPCHTLWFEADGTAREVVPYSDRMDSCMVLLTPPGGPRQAEMRRRNAGPPLVTAPQPAAEAIRLFASQSIVPEQHRTLLLAMADAAAGEGGAR